MDIPQKISLKCGAKGSLCVSSMREQRESVNWQNHVYKIINNLLIYSTVDYTIRLGLLNYQIHFHNLPKICSTILILIKHTYTHAYTQTQLYKYFCLANTLQPCLGHPDSICYTNCKLTLENDALLLTQILCPSSKWP